MKIKRIFIMLGLVGFAGFSSYAMAQSYVYRTPSPVAKADEQSEAQKEKDRVEEERQEQGNIDMCLNQSSEDVLNKDAELVSGATPVDDHWFVYHREGDRFYVSGRIPNTGSYAYKETRLDRTPSEYNKKLIMIIKNEYYDETDHPHDMIKSHFIGEKTNRFDNEQDDIYKYNSAVYTAYHIDNVRLETEKTENYDWCVENGYETAN